MCESARGWDLRAHRTGDHLDALTPYRGIVTPPPLPAPPPLDPTEALLETPLGRIAEGHAGDLCSLLGIVGAATLLLNHRGGRSAGVEWLGERIVAGSVGAGALDTAIQARNVLKDDGAGAERRGHDRSSWGTVAYAATGLIPAASLKALRGLHRHPSPNEVAALSVLAVNGAMVGYETVTRAPKALQGQEDASGYGSWLASMGGFVVAKRFVTRA